MDQSEVTFQNLIGITKFLIKVMPQFMSLKILLGNDVCVSHQPEILPAFYPCQSYMVMIFSCLFYLHVTETSVKYLKKPFEYTLSSGYRGLTYVRQTLLKLEKKYLNYICLKAPGIYQDTEDLRIENTSKKRHEESEPNIFFDMRQVSKLH